MDKTRTSRPKHHGNKGPGLTERGIHKPRTLCVEFQPLELAVWPLWWFGGQPDTFPALQLGRGMEERTSQCMQSQAARVDQEEVENSATLDSDDLPLC
jgi:hypothetical protein